LYSFACFHDCLSTRTTLIYRQNNTSTPPPRFSSTSPNLPTHPDPDLLQDTQKPVFILPPPSCHRQFTPNDVKDSSDGGDHLKSPLKYPYKPTHAKTSAESPLDHSTSHTSTRSRESTCHYRQSHPPSHFLVPRNLNSKNNASNLGLDSFPGKSTLVNTILNVSDLNSDSILSVSAKRHFLGTFGANMSMKMNCYGFRLDAIGKSTSELV